MASNAVYLDALPDAPGLVTNNAGATQVFQIDKWSRFERFLILGSSGGSYYASAKGLTDQNLDNVKACISEDGLRAVTLIADVSIRGRAVKQSPGILALAHCASAEDVETRRAAWSALPDVCRIPTTLFEFATYVGKLRGKGRQYRNGFANWYESKDVNDLAYQLVKYRQRDGWTNKDLIQLSHATPASPERKALFDWAFEKPADAEALPRIVEGYERAKTATGAEVVELVHDYNLPWEALPTESLTDPKVWAALIEEGIPQTALIRQLPRLTKLGLLVPGSLLTTVTSQLVDPDRLKRARVHPFTVLNALVGYQSGEGKSSSWQPVRKVSDALDSAFYAAFGNVESTGKRTLISLDCSASMTWEKIAGLNLNPRQASAAMALVTEAVEPNALITGFSNGTISRGGWGSGPTHSDGINEIDISSKDRLDTVIGKIDNQYAGGTNCGLPMIWAQARGLEIDTFIIYTDNETWAGRKTPAQCLKDYRRATGIEARLVVVGATATEFSIADPKDRGMLDVVGFDTSAPGVISAFSKGEL